MTPNPFRLRARPRLAFVVRHAIVVALLVAVSGNGKESGLSARAAGDGDVRVAWTANNQAQVWFLDDGGFAGMVGLGGPASGWTLQSYWENADHSWVVLWTADNAAQLWFIDPGGSWGGSLGFSGPGTGWQATSYFRNPDGNYQLLWTASNQAQVWTINADDTWNSGFGLSGPASGWRATSYEHAPDGSHKVLWTADNQAHLWTITAALGWGGAVGLGGPAAGWIATSYHLNIDGSWNVLWSADNQAQVWTITESNEWGGALGPGGPGEGWTAQSYVKRQFPSDPALGISGSVSPTPSGEAWNNSPIVVSFTCSGPFTTCTNPITVSSEGAAHEVVGTVANAAAENHTSVEVNIDMTPPSVAITSPGSGSTAATSVSVTGTVSDSLSGVAEVTCNGVAATVAGNNLSCTVPLGKGRNSVVVLAIDAAGNSNSSGIMVTRTGTATALRISPNSRTIAVGNQLSLAALDDFGSPATGASWSTSNASVATVSTTGGITTLTGVGAGSATITATYAGLTTDLSVSVVAALGNGDVVWRADPLGSAVATNMLYPFVVSADVPESVSVEYDEGANRFTTRALSSSGDQLWQEDAPGSPLLADAFGGLIASTENGIARFGGPPGAAPWGYKSATAVVPWVQGPDGTLFTVEESPNDMFGRFVVGVDGETGRTKFRRALPVSTFQNLNIDCISGFNTFSRGPAGVGSLSVGEDGKAYFLVSHGDSAFNYLPCEIGSSSATSTLERWAVSPDGAIGTVNVREYEGPITSEVTSVGPTTPDGSGEVLAFWGLHDPVANTSDSKVSRGAATYSLGSAGVPSFVDSHAAYFQENGTLSARSTAGWGVIWSDETTGVPVGAMNDGGVVVADASTGQLVSYSSNGTTTGAAAVAGLTNMNCTLTFGTCHGILDGTIPSPAATLSLMFDPSPFEFQVGQGGNPQRQGAAPAWLPDRDAAALQGLRRYGPVGWRENAEYGGFVCKKSDVEFRPSVPRRDYTRSDSVVPYPCVDLPGTTKVGPWHTHVLSNTNGMSGGDALCAKFGCSQVSLTDGGAGKPWWVFGGCGMIERWTYTGTANDAGDPLNPNGGYVERVALVYKPCAP